MLMQYEGAVSSFEETKKKMKLLVPPDAKQVQFSGSNYLITRNKKGTLAVKGETKMKFTLKEIILMWNKTYNENMCEKYSGFINNLIVEYDNARDKNKDRN